MNASPVVFVVPKEETGITLSSFLRRRGVSLRMVRSLKYLPRGIVVNDKEAHTNHVLVQGDRVELGALHNEGLSARPEEIPLSIVYQSAEALVLNKPAGMVMHPGPSHHSGTLANAVCGLFHKQRKAGVFRPVGRLDGDTSGLVLCAANAASALILGKTLQKEYIALVGGYLPLGEGNITAPLGPKQGSAVAQAVRIDGRDSQTDYTVLATANEASLVSVKPRTGRTHQIRAHFAHLGNPLLGDAMYGGDTQVLHRHALHCARIHFDELCGNSPTFTCPLPNDLGAVAAAFGFDVPTQYRV